MRRFPRIPMSSRELTSARRFFVLFIATVSLFSTVVCQAQPASQRTSRATSQPTSQPALASNPAEIGGGDPEFAAKHHLKAEDDAPLAGKMISIPVKGVEDELSAYLAAPEKALPGEPALVVIHEWWGLNKHIKHTADLLAKQGYTALAVDLYGGSAAQNADEARALMGAVDQSTAIAQLVSAAEYLRADNPDRKVGSIGWCFGGGYSAQLARNDSELDACVIYYGIVPQTAEEAGEIHAPVLGIFAGQEKWISPEMVAKFKQAADEAGVDLTVKSYDADHAFANPSNDRFNKEAAQAAWEETYAFFAQHLSPESD